MPQSTITAATALAHERLYPRVIALLKQVERAAARHPEHPVPDATREVAKSLFAEARKILGREAMRSLGGVTADLNALSVGLGQVVAGLEGFEAAHSGWSGKVRCTVWLVEGSVMPVARLKPDRVEAVPIERKNPVSDRHRDNLCRLIMARLVAGCDDGHRDAREGKPPSLRYAETVWTGSSNAPAATSRPGWATFGRAAAPPSRRRS